MRVGFTLFAILGLSACSTVQNESVANGSQPIVIAHRGASGTLPEHTLEAYKLAIDQGADFIEPDLVMTKDGVLIARHDPWLSDSTDVTDHPEFADRKTTVTDPNGREITDWFAWDFTLEEIKTLRARQTRTSRDLSFDDQFEIPTFEEIIGLVGMTNHDRKPASTEGYLGVYPELKWPSAHESRGLDIADAANTQLVFTLTRQLASDPPATVAAPVRPGEDQYRTDPCYWRRCTFRVRIQSFEDGVLRQLNETTDWKLVQLVSPSANGSPSYALEDIATYADGVGPFKSLMMDLETGEPTGYGAKARALGLEVHPWTFRDDDIAPVFDSPEAEIRAILNAGATGFFTDFPATGRRVVDEIAG